MDAIPNRFWLRTAGCNVPASCRDRVGGEGSHLERYWGALNAVEIDSSFYRPHRRSTYERWAGATPSDFRFSVKVPKALTHATDFDRATINRFIGEVAGLGSKLAILLVQPPPRAAFDVSWAARLFEALASRTLCRLFVNCATQAGFETIRTVVGRPCDRSGRSGSAAGQGSRSTWRLAGLALFPSARITACLLFELWQGKRLPKSASGFPSHSLRPRCGASSTTRLREPRWRTLCCSQGG